MLDRITQLVILGLLAAMIPGFVMFRDALIESKETDYVARHQCHIAEIILRGTPPHRPERRRRFRTQASDTNDNIEEWHVRPTFIRILEPTPTGRAVMPRILGRLDEDRLQRPVSMYARAPFHVEDCGIPVRTTLKPSLPNWVTTEAPYFDEIDLFAFRDFALDRHSGAILVLFDYLPAVARTSYPRQAYSLTFRASPRDDGWEFEALEKKRIELPMYAENDRPPLSAPQLLRRTADRGKHITYIPY